MPRHHRLFLRSFAEAKKNKRKPETRGKKKQNSGRWFKPKCQGRKGIQRSAEKYDEKKPKKRRAREYESRDAYNG